MDWKESILANQEKKADHRISCPYKENWRNQYEDLLKMYLFALVSFPEGGYIV